MWVIPSPMFQENAPAKNARIPAWAEAGRGIGGGETWVALGERTYEQIARPRAELLAPGVRFVQTRVAALELAERRVVTEQGALGFDQLVIALGAGLNPPAVAGT